MIHTCKACGPMVGRQGIKRQSDSFLTRRGLDFLFPRPRRDRSASVIWLRNSRSHGSTQGTPRCELTPVDISVSRAVVHPHEVCCASSRSLMPNSMQMHVHALSSPLTAHLCQEKASDRY